MEDDVDSTVIRNTQLSLGKYVKRPPLSDKLLRKPPFRFLHDIVTSILKSKGFFDGLFDENELTSENVKDRESKISFLNKVITVVSLTTGKQLTVKPSKIVAGQEPAKTNELLQCLAYALDNNLSSEEAVKQFKSEGKIPPGNKKSKESVKSVKKNMESKESKKLTSKSSEKLVASEKDGHALNKSKNRDVSVHKKESPPKKPLSKTSNRKVIENSNKEGKKNIISEPKNVLAEQKPADNLSKQSHEQILNEDSIKPDKLPNSSEKVLHSDISLQDDLSNSATENPQEQQIVDVIESNLKRSSANESMQKDEQPDLFEAEKENTISSHSLITDKKSIDHASEETKNHSIPISNDSSINDVFHVESEGSSQILTGNSFDKKDVTSTIRPSSVRPSSSRPGAPRIRDKTDNVMNDAENILVGKVNIISENTLQEEEEDTSIIFENNTTEEPNEPLTNQEHNDVLKQNSHLVQQILHSQKEFSQKSGKTEIEWQFAAQKAPDIFVQEMEQLKFNVQALSRIANPLGKLLDHIQEDVEVMRQELQQWTQLYEETSKDLLIQNNATTEVLLPYHTKLKQLAVDTEERHEKITDLKMSIHKNNSRIEKLLTNNNVQ